MTANELADELVWIAKNRGDSISRQLADIVCQQQAEIKALKAKLKLNDEILKPMLIEYIKSSTQRTQQEVFFRKYDSVRKVQEK